MTLLLRRRLSAFDKGIHGCWGSGLRLTLCHAHQKYQIERPHATTAGSKAVIADVSMVLASIAFGALIAAAVYDVVRFEIPDMLSVIILVTALGHGAMTPGFHWPSHLAAIMIMFIIGLLVFWLNAMGGADIKLLVAIAGWTGLGGLAQQLTAVVIAGGLLALVLILVRAVAAQRAAPEHLPRIARKGAPLPYAVAIAVGTGWWANGNWSVT